jgi:hypothetical protein
MAVLLVKAAVEVEEEAIPRKEAMEVAKGAEAPVKEGLVPSAKTKVTPSRSAKSWQGG